jgi:hypothetical protein
MSTPSLLKPMGKSTMRTTMGVSCDVQVEKFEMRVPALTRSPLSRLPEDSKLRLLQEA